MIEMIYVDETTSEESIQKFDTLQYALAEVIRVHIINIFQDEIKNVSAVTDVMSNKEGNKLIVGVMRNRNTNEETADKYRIIIEKI